MSQGNNSLDLYASFKDLIRDDNFPILTAAILDIKEDVVNKEQLFNLIPKNLCGWIMYTDRIEVGKHTDIDKQSYILEAEFVDSQDQNITKKIKLLYGDTYLLSTYICQEQQSNDSNFCYYEKSLYARQDLQNNEKRIKYRFWYKLEAQGQWIPFLQQFVGFEKED